MKRIFSVFLIGLIIGEMDLIGKIFWSLIRLYLPKVKEKSLSKESPFEKIPKSEWISESENVFAIRNKSAIDVPIHILVIPKKRFINLLDIEPEILKEMFLMVKQLVKEYKIDESGFRIIINNNPEGGQSVYHLHIHIRGGTQQRSSLITALFNFIAHRSI